VVGTATGNSSVIVIMQCMNVCSPQAVQNKGVIKRHRTIPNITSRYRYRHNKCRLNNAQIQNTNTSYQNTYGTQHVTRRTLGYNTTTTYQACRAIQQPANNAESTPSPAPRASFIRRSRQPVLFRRNMSVRHLQDCRFLFQTQ